MHKKIPLHGMLRGMPGLAGQARRDAWKCLICDRDRVGHRTAVKLSFARLRPKLPATADQREVARAARCAEIV
jgi:hypothetical protein